MKSEIRKTIRAKKKELGKEQLLTMSLPITELIEANKQYHEAPIVMLYHPLWDEVDVRPLFDRALASGKRVILPTVKGDDIIPVEITSDTQWVVGYYDRFLAHHPNAYRLGVCFKFQIVPEVPTESFDLPMHELITV